MKPNVFKNYLDKKAKFGGAHDQNLVDLIVGTDMERYRNLVKRHMVEEPILGRNLQLKSILQKYAETKNSNFARIIFDEIFELKGDHKRASF